MIPIKALVRDGCWLNCTVRSKFVQGEVTVRMRVLSFERLDYAEIGKAVSLEPIAEGAILWLLKLEVVNLCKASVLFGYLTEEMRVVDSDGFQFERDDAGLYFSDFAKRVGLSLGSLLPKLKAQGAVIFKVPDEDSEFSLAFKNGSSGESVGQS